MSNLIDRHLKIPKYLQLAEHLREQIDGGHLQPDDRLPSFTEMKAQFEATQRTIEKAHALLEEDGLIRREPGRGVFVNHPHHRQMTGNVGFVLPPNMQPELGLTYWGLVLNGIRQAARERDYHLLLIDEDNTFDRWDKMDGVVLCDTRDPRNLEPVMPLPPRDFPRVAVSNRIADTACVTVDDFDGAYQLTRHLIELGHRRIAYLGTFNAGLSQLEQRKEGYLKALQEADIEFDARWMRELLKQKEWIGQTYWYPLAGEYHTRCWLEEDWYELGCTALIAQNDHAARGAMKAFRNARLDVPRDVSVVGFDGLPTYPDEVPLTTIAIPLFEMGKLAMESLLDWLENPTQIPQDITLPINIVHGKTTAQPSAKVTEQVLIAGHV